MSSTEPTQNDPVPPTEASAGNLDTNGSSSDAPAEPAPADAAAPPAEGETAEEASTEGAPEGGPGEKKKRRRRKKKKGGAPGEGQEAQGGQSPQQQPQHAKRRDREPMRERPAFGVGDVVFGKIIDITEEALIVDLSGKAHAIFDKRELLLPEEPAQGPGSELNDDDDFDPGDLIAADATPHAPAVAEGAEAQRATLLQSTQPRRPQSR